MIRIEISDSFIKERGVKQPVRCRTKNKEKSDLTPINQDNIRYIIGQTKGTANTMSLKSTVKGIALQRKVQSEDYGVEKLRHSFVGVYEIERLTSKVEKSLKRDLMALVLQKSREIEVRIYLSDFAQPYIIRRIACTDYNNLFQKIKNIVLTNLKLKL